MPQGGIGGAKIGGQMPANVREPLNKSVTIPVVPAMAGTSVHNVLGSCLRRNDGVKALKLPGIYQDLL